MHQNIIVRTSLLKMMHEMTRLIIKRLIAERGIPSERQLALDCGMSQPSLNRFLSGKTDTLEFHNIKSLAEYFGLTVSQLIGETPFNSDPKIRSVVTAMEQMSDYQKDVLVASSHALTKPERPTGTH